MSETIYDFVDKNTAGATSRSWFVPPDVLDEGVKPFTYDGVTRFLASTFTGAKLAFQAKLYRKWPGNTLKRAMGKRYGGNYRCSQMN